MLEKVKELIREDWQNVGEAVRSHLERQGLEAEIERLGNTADSVVLRFRLWLPGHAKKLL